jgi:hypothetical protein
MAEAPLPVGYEVLLVELEAQAEAIPADGTINSQSSWILRHPPFVAAAVALLRHHLKARVLGAGQKKMLRRRWGEAVGMQVLNPVNTCLGRSSEGLQCREVVPDVESSGVCAGHKDQVLLVEMEAEFGAAHEAGCLVCYQDFDNEASVACVMCYQRVHAEDCWDALFKQAGLKTPKQDEVDAVLCGMCTVTRTFDFTLLWEVSEPGMVHLMPPTQAQCELAGEINGGAWLKESYQLLCAEVTDPQVATSQSLVVMGARGRARGFQKYATPEKERAKRRLSLSSRGGSSGSSRGEETPRTVSPEAAPRKGRREGGDAELLIALRKLTAEVEQLKTKASHSGMPDDEAFELSMVSDLVSGRTAGVKRGESGSFANPNFAGDEPYTAMPDRGCSWQTNSVKSVLGQEDAQGNRLAQGATPEATRNDQFLTLEGGMVKVKHTKYVVPGRNTIARWEEGRTEQIQLVLDSEEDGFQEGDAGAAVLRYSLQLTLGRYEFLREFKKVLCDEEDVPWPVVWRYTDRFSRLHFQGRINTRSALSRDLVEAVRMTKQSRRNATISILARSNRDLSMLERATKDHAEVLRQAVPVDTGAGPANRQERAPQAPRADRAGQNRAEREHLPRAPAGRCPLCMSTEHKYVRGDYGHTDRENITEECQRMQPDGNTCGRKHAFAGPLGTDCMVRPRLEAH